MVESANKLLRKTRGYIGISDGIMEEINNNSPGFIQEISTSKDNNMYDTARNERRDIHLVCPSFFL